MTKSLKNAGGIVVKDLTPFFSEHTLNAICGVLSTDTFEIYMIILSYDTFTNAFAETAMGTSLRGLGDFQQQYREAVYQMGELLAYRLMRQWLHSD
ncbi:Uncharacterized protein DBV15_07407 [Temnothorax longispinosus]|uniref:Uncharacterized protein n=1 Tax=Temnothorax longispinosus TaxID=300112 RepID=A0A4S2JJC6_9HYME|nr:Uncharacterized protein DBV15_07407 [Temnothorax longispinosus]